MLLRLKTFLLIKSFFVNKYLPKQFPLYGMNILQAVAIGSSTDRIDFIMQSSIRIINPEVKINVTTITLKILETLIYEIKEIMLFKSLVLLFHINNFVNRFFLCLIILKLGFGVFIFQVPVVSLP